MTDTARGQQPGKALSKQGYSADAISLAEGHRLNGLLSRRQARALSRRTIAPQPECVLADPAEIEGRGEKSARARLAGNPPAQFSRFLLRVLSGFFSRRISGAREILSLIRQRGWESY